MRNDSVFVLPTNRPRKKRPMDKSSKRRIDPPGPESAGSAAGKENADPADDSLYPADILKILAADSMHGIEFVL